MERIMRRAIAMLITAQSSAAIVDSKCYPRSGGGRAVKLSASLQLALAALKILYRFFVFFSCGACFKRTKIFSFVRFRILLSRVKAILTGLEFSNHVFLLVFT